MSARKRAAERIGAALLGPLMAASMPVAIVVDAHLF